MTDTPIDEPVADQRQLMRNLAVEDLILYAFGAVILLMFWVMFSGVQESERAPSQITTETLDAWQPAGNDTLELAHLKAQLANSAMRYEQAMRTTAGISTRHDFGFLVGAILALLGAIIGIRGTRGETINATVAKAKIVTTSSGAFIAFLGALIILAAVVNNDHAQVKDGGITLALPVEQSGETPPATDTTRDERAALAAKIRNQTRPK